MLRRLARLNRVARALLGLWSVAIFFVTCIAFLAGASQWNNAYLVEFRSVVRAPAEDGGAPAIDYMSYAKSLRKEKSAWLINATNSFSQTGEPTSFVYCGPERDIARDFFIKRTNTALARPECSVFAQAVRTEPWSVNRVSHNPQGTFHEFERNEQLRIATTISMAIQASVLFVFYHSLWVMWVVTLVVLGPLILVQEYRENTKFWHDSARVSVTTVMLAVLGATLGLYNAVEQTAGMVPPFWFQRVVLGLWYCWGLAIGAGLGAFGSVIPMAFKELQLFGKLKDTRLTPDEKRRSLGSFLVLAVAAALMFAVTSIAVLMLLNYGFGVVLRWAMGWLANVFLSEQAGHIIKLLFSDNDVSM